MVRTALRIGIAVTVTAVCLYFALRGVDWSEIRVVLGRTNYGWVAVMAGMSVLAVYLRALRWGVLLEPVARVGMRPLFSATAVGFLANILLPLRAGEVIRPVLLGRETGVRTQRREGTRYDRERGMVINFARRLVKDGIHCVVNAL